MRRSSAPSSPIMRSLFLLVIAAVLIVVGAALAGITWAAVLAVTFVEVLGVALVIAGALLASTVVLAWIT